MRVIIMVLVCWLASPVLAHEVSLIDLLTAKGVITKSEAQKLKSGGKEGETQDVDSLIGLLKAKGILTDQDLAQLQEPSAPAADTSERLSRIEAQQQALTAQAQAQAQATQQAELKKTALDEVKKNFDWLNRFSLFGDIRVRHEGFYQEQVSARNRERLRLRVGARIKISDELEGGLRLVSGDANEIAANNQSLTDVFSRKPINIDNAYITIRPSKTIGLEKAFFSITAGKFVVPFFRPRAVMGSELVYDEDLTPEGLTEEIILLEGKGLFRSLKFAASQWAVKEFAAVEDSFMVGEQVQLALAPTSKSELVFAAADYYFLNSKAIAQERNRNGSLTLTNSVRLRTGTIVQGGDLIVPNNQNPIQRFLGGFNIVNASAQLTLDTGYPRWPLSVMVDFAHNTQAEGGDDSAYLAGVGLGQTKNPGDWAVSALWTRVETDSVISMFTLSDYGRRGGTNVEGPILKLDYMLFPRLTLTAKGYFVNFIDRPSGLPNSTVNRLQFDAMFVF